MTVMEGFERAPEAYQALLAVEWVQGPYRWEPKGMEWHCPWCGIRRDADMGHRVDCKRQLALKEAGLVK